MQSYDNNIISINAQSFHGFTIVYIQSARLQTLQLSRILIYVTPNGVSATFYTLAPEVTSLNEYPTTS
jgi:hypothetical protein